MSKLTLLIARAALVLLPAAALAGGYEVPNVNPRDLSMAGSLVAAQDSAAASYVNPAALGRLPGLRVSAAISTIDFRANWTDPTGKQLPLTAESDSSLVFPPALFLSYGGRLESPDLGWGIGLGFTVPGGGNVFWPTGWPGRFDILSVDRRIYGTYLTGGLEPLPWLRVGGGLIWYRGTEKLEQVQNFLTNEGTAQLGTSGSALSYDLSAEVQPIQPLKIGIDYKHQGAMNLTGHAHFENPPPQLAPNALDQGVSHPLTFPNELLVGASYQVLPTLLVTAQFSWYRFIVYNEDAFQGTAGTNLVVTRNYHNGQTYRLGAELEAIPQLKVRAGILRDISPTPAEWVSATIPDSNVWGVSIGAGYTITRGLDANIAYFHAFFDSVNSTATGQNNVFPAIYEPRANIASIGLTWTPDFLRQ
jgi:long-chain fatty acid transport protein